MKPKINFLENHRKGGCLDRGGRLTSAGMALQYCPVDIPIRTRLSLLLAFVMAGGFLFFPPLGNPFPFDSFDSAAVFPCTEHTLEPCPAPLVLPPGGASLGEGEVWGLPEQGRAAYTPYECSAPSTSRLERGHAFSSFAALSGNCFCPGILLRRGSISSAVSIFPHDWDSGHACPRSPPAA